MKTMTSWFMIALLSVTLLIGGLLVQSCAAFQKAETYLPSPKDIACVLEEVEAGNEDPVVVANKCGLVNLVVEDVLKLITGAKMAKAKRLASARDAGAGPPLDAGAK